MLTVDVGGLQVPDAGPVFRAALGVHVAAGLTAVLSGALASAARKRRGGHPRAGLVYLWAVSAVAATAMVMATIRWERDRHLALVAGVAFALAMAGLWSRRRRPRRWLLWHGAAMAGSYVALLTGFYVDNGPRLPLWNRLPDAAFWVLPAAVGVPLTWWALARNGAVRGRPLAARHTAGPPSRRR